jgi:hypothetical protein
VLSDWQDNAPVFVEGVRRFSSAETLPLSSLGLLEETVKILV